MALPKIRSSAPLSAADLAALVHEKERLYFNIALFTSAVLYAFLIIAFLSAGQAAATIAVYGLMFVLSAFMLQGMMLGRIRGNGIKVSPWQLPDVYRVARAHASKLGISKLPEIYVVQAGTLNAFATRFMRRDFVVLHSDVVELALERGEGAVGFIVAHELAHVARGHVKHGWLLWPSRLVPYLYPAYSRACEYTCDRLAAQCQPEGAIPGLLVLAAGRQLYRHVDWQQFALQASTEKDTWVKRAERASTHPNLTKRVAALIAAGVPVTSAAPMHADFGLPATRATQAMAAISA